MWAMVKEGGWGSYGALALGVLGLIGGILALSTLPLSRRTGHIVGVVVLVIAFLAPAVGVLGMVSSRRAIDAAAASDQRAGRGAHTRHDGWRASQSAARIGLYAFLAPLLLGSIAAYFGARKADEETKLTRKFAAVTGGLALVTGLGAFAASKGPLPPEPSPGAARLQDARGEIEHARGALGAGCFELEQTVLELYWHAEDKGEWPRHFDSEVRTVLPDYDALAAQCVRYRKGYASQNDLLTTPLLVDEDLKREIEAWPGTTAWGGSYGVDHTNEDLPDGGSAATVTIGPVTVTGRQAAFVARKIVTRSGGLFRRCYAEGLARSSTLHGRMTMKLIISTSGSVTSKTYEEDLADRKVVNCIVDVFDHLSFPERPENYDGPASVELSLVFTTGK